MPEPPEIPRDLPPLTLVPLPKRSEQRREDGTFGEGNRGTDPHFFDDQIRLRILTFIQAGANYAQAARAAGINRQRIHDWMRRGREAKEGDEAYVIFLEEIETAEAFAEMRLLGLVSAHAKTDWRAGMAMLKARWPERWAREGQDADPGFDREELVRPKDDIEHLSEVMAAYEEADIVPGRVVEADG